MKIVTIDGKAGMVIAEYEGMMTVIDEDRRVHLAKDGVSIDITLWERRHTRFSDPEATDEEPTKLFKVTPLGVVRVKGRNITVIMNNGKELWGFDSEGRIFKVTPLEIGGEIRLLVRETTRSFRNMLRVIA